MRVSVLLADAQVAVERLSALVAEGDRSRASLAGHRRQTQPQIDVGGCELCSAPSVGAGVDEQPHDDQVAT